MPDEEATRYCSRCGQEVVVPDAAFCKSCGAELSVPGSRARAIDGRSVTAALLSVVPGLGHLYRGRIFAGVLWFFGVAFAYHLGPVGFLIHLACAANAALDRRERRFRRRQRRYSGGLGPVR